MRIGHCLQESRCWPALATTLLLGSLLLASCFGRSTRTETQTADEGSSVSTSFTVHRSPHAASIDRARQHVIDGRFDEAIAVCTRVYEDQKADGEYRAQALFELGQIYSHLLNPRRDEAKALLYFQKLVEECPDSELRGEAEKKIERMRASGQADHS